MQSSDSTATFKLTTPEHYYTDYTIVSSDLEYIGIAGALTESKENSGNKDTPPDRLKASLGQGGVVGP